MAQLDKMSVKTMLALFAAVAVVGVLVMLFSIILGIFLLGVAEVFFVLAYRRFSKTAKAAS